MHDHLHVQTLQQGLRFLALIAGDVKHRAPLEVVAGGPQQLDEKSKSLPGIVRPHVQEVELGVLRPLFGRCIALRLKTERDGDGFDAWERLNAHPTRVLGIAHQQVGSPQPGTQF